MLFELFNAPRNASSRLALQPRRGGLVGGGGVLAGMSHVTCAKWLCI